jgi:hypothetical protein
LPARNGLWKRLVKLPPILIISLILRFKRLYK